MVTTFDKLAQKRPYQSSKHVGQKSDVSISVILTFCLLQNVYWFCVLPIQNLGHLSSSACHNAGGSFCYPCWMNFKRLCNNLTTARALLNPVKCACKKCENGAISAAPPQTSLILCQIVPAGFNRIRGRTRRAFAELFHWELLWKSCALLFVFEFFPNPPPLPDLLLLRNFKITSSRLGIFGVFLFIPFFLSARIWKSNDIIFNVFVTYFCCDCIIVNFRTVKIFLWRENITKISIKSFLCSAPFKNSPPTGENIYFHCLKLLTMKKTVSMVFMCTPLCH